MSQHSKGGKARAKNLSPEKRREIATKAANARWASPRALFEGTLQISENVCIPCAVLDDGTRLLTQQGFLKALGRARSAKGGQGSTHGNVIPFLAAKNLQPYISEELKRISEPVIFKTEKGIKAFGYKAELLPNVCEVYLKVRDDGKDHQSQSNIVKMCDIIMRGLAHIGIIALVDEATGYQEVRDRLALQKILKKFIDGKLYEWTKTFPDEFFKQIFRLKKWQWNSGRMPGVVGRYINDLIYDRITPNLLDELRRNNPKNEKGNRKHRHHQFFTKDIGHPELTGRIYQLLGMARVSKSWEEFYEAVDEAFPKQGSTLKLPF